MLATMSKPKKLRQRANVVFDTDDVEIQSPKRVSRKRDLAYHRKYNRTYYEKNKDKLKKKAKIRAERRKQEAVVNINPLFDPSNEEMDNSCMAATANATAAGKPEQDPLDYPFDLTCHEQIDFTESDSEDTERIPIHSSHDRW